MIKSNDKSAYPFQISRWLYAFVLPDPPDEFPFTADKTPEVKSDGFQVSATKARA